MLTTLRSGGTWFGSHNCARELSLVQSVLSGCHSTPRIQYIPAVLSAGKHASSIEVNGISSPSASQRMCRDITLLHSNQLRYLLYRSNETIRPVPVPGCNSGRVSISSGSDYPSKATWKLYVPKVRLQ
jgi:hypothetical protein